MSRWVSSRSFRQVVEEHEVSAKVDEFCASLHRFDEAYEALKWELARGCGDLEGKNEATFDGKVYHLYRQDGDPMAGTPNIVVLFTYDDKQVNLVSVRVDEINSKGG